MVELLEQNQEKIHKLCERYFVKQLKVFGSAARESDFSPESDLDFIVEFEILPPSNHAKAYFGLLFGLEDLLDREIDLAEISAIKNPYVLRTIEKDLMPFYATAR